MGRDRRLHRDYGADPLRGWGPGLGAREDRRRLKRPLRTTPYRRTRPSLLVHQTVRSRSRTRGASSTPQNSRNSSCAWAAAILEGAASRPVPSAVVACGGDKDTPLAVRWDAPRSAIAAAAALCGDAGASDDAAQSAARVLAAKIVSSQNELAAGDADAPPPIDALSRRASLGGPGAAVAARAFVEALANGSRDASRCFGPGGPVLAALRSACARSISEGASALAAKRASRGGDVVRRRGAVLRRLGGF